MLNRDQILQQGKPRYADVDVPEWGGSIRIREMQGEELVGLSTEESDNPSVLGAARDIVKFAVDEENRPLFTDKDIPEVAKLGAAGIMRIHRAILSLNGLNATEKNSEASR